MAKMCPVCKVKQAGMCIHQKMMLVVMGLAMIAIVVILIVR